MIRAIVLLVSTACMGQGPSPSPSPSPRPSPSASGRDAAQDTRYRESYGPVDPAEIERVENALARIAPTRLKIKRAVSKGEVASTGSLEGFPIKWNLNARGIVIATPDERKRLLAQLADAEKSLDAQLAAINARLGPPDLDLKALRVGQFGRLPVADTIREGSGEYWFKYEVTGVGGEFDTFVDAQICTGRYADCKTVVNLRIRGASTLDWREGLGIKPAGIFEVAERKYEASGTSEDYWVLTAYTPPP
jgi:hypothetical protein